MAESGRFGITRSRFIGLGLSTLVLSSTAAFDPFVAKARTVSFIGASSAKITQFPYNCRGDGSDETEKIQRCVNENRYVEIPEPPAGVGYGIGPVGVAMPSGLELNGHGVNSKLLRVGPWRKNQRLLKNSDHVLGNSSIKLNNIYISGFRGAPEVPKIDSDAGATGISIFSREHDHQCEDIELTGVQVHNWPGVSIRIMNTVGVRYTDVKSVNPARGGIIFNAKSSDIRLLRVTSTDSGDDAIAFYATGGTISGIIVDRCVGKVRRGAQYGAALKFLGATDAQVVNSTFSNAKNSVVFITTAAGGYHPGNIRINDSQMLGGQKCSFQIRANGANNISARRNRMEGPAEECVRVQSLNGAARRFDVTITDNDLVRPGLGTFINVQDNLSGVRTSGNTLVRTDTTKPTISGVSPRPDATISDATPTIKATVKDGVTDLSKSNLRLYVAGVAVASSDFTYDRTSDLLTYTPSRRLSTGKKSVKIVAKDAAGNTAAKSWSFTIASSDATKPTIDVLSPRPDATISDATPTIKATVKDGVTDLSKSNLRLYVAGVAVASSDFTYDRTSDLLTYTPSRRLSAGKKLVKIVAKDAAGNTAAKSWSFTIASSDATKPTISGVSPKPNAKIRDTTPTIKATVKDGVTDLSKSNLRLYVAGKTIAASSFGYDRAKNLLTYTPSRRLSAGKKLVKIVAKDAAGNTATKSWSFTIG